MGMSTEVFTTAEYARAAAGHIAERLPVSGSVVVTGGETAALIYDPLAGLDADWSDLVVLFSDERCVPPDSDESNFKVADTKLLRTASPRQVHRMEGEREPAVAADEYHVTIAGVVQAGLDLVILGIGADCHICALFPGSPALGVTSSLCVPVDRPDGLKGITLTPQALAAGRRFVVIASGDSKAEAIKRAVTGEERPIDCPARLLADHDVTFLLDEAAASAL